MSDNNERNEGVGSGRQPFHTPEPTLWDYVRVVSTRRWMVLSVFLCTVLVFALWVFTRTPIYRSRAVLQIDPGRSAMPPIERAFEQSPFAVNTPRDFIETQTMLIREDRLVEMTFDHFGIGGKPGFRDAENPLEVFKGLFVVNAIRRTRLVEVNFDWPDPKEGARILDYHVRQYVADYNRRKRESADVVLAGLQRQRDQFAPQVEKARSDLQAFKEKHNVVAFEQNQDTVTEDLRARAQAVSESREELSVISARLEQIESAVKNHTPVENLPDVLKSPLIRDYRNQKAKAEQDLREGLKRFGEQHPEIKALKAKLDSTSENIRIEIGRILSAAVTERASAEQVLALREKQFEEQRRAVQDFNRLKLEYDRLRSLFETQNQIYIRVADAIEQCKVVAQSQSDETVTVERYPRAEVEPAKPRKAIVLGLACLFGLALGIGLAFLMDNLDTSIKSKDDVSRHLGLNLLGYVPEVDELRIAQRRHSHDGLVILNDPRSPVAEAFRSIRTALSFSAAAQDVNRIMVTSSSPSEGKTLVCVNAAAALAQAGKRVLLVDADMRKPAVHKIFEVDQNPGLTNVLAGEGAHTLDDVVRPTDLPNLFFIPCGPIPPNPAELIGCDRMKALLDEMGSEYDRVIIDTPPVINVTDAAVLCGSVHGVVFVVRSFRTPRDAARRAVEVLANSGGRFLGAVLNNVDVPRGAYHYYDSYYYYQQYYYYGDDGGKRKRRKRAERGSHKATA